MIELALFAQLVLWLVLIGFFLASRQASLFHPASVYLAFHGLVFVLRPILVHYFGFDANWRYMLFRPTEEHFIRTLAVSSVGLTCFVVASLAAGWTEVSFTDPHRPRFTRVEKQALLLTTLVLLPAVAYSIYATRNGIEGERIGGIYVMTNSTGYLNEAQHFAMPLICLWLVVTRFYWLNLFPVLAYIGYRAWFGWSRWTILLFLFMVCLSYCWYYRKKWLPLWAIFALVPTLIVFNVLGHNRDLLKDFLAGEQVRVIEPRPGTSRADKLRQELDTQDYSNFDYLAYVVSVVPERTGTFTYWLQYLQLFTEPVPRILWKGKPVGAPVKTIDIGAYGNFVGLTVSLCGDGWISGGWVGLILTLSLAGGLAGRAHRWFWEHHAATTGPLVYLAVLALLPQWYRDGGISIFKFLLFTLVPLFTWMGMQWWWGRRTVPVYSLVLPRETPVRVVHAKGTAPRWKSPLRQA